MTWGKVDPDQLPDTVTCYLDSTVFLPILTVYSQATHEPRKHKRLMDRLEGLTDGVLDDPRLRHDPNIVEDYDERPCDARRAGRSGAGGRAQHRLCAIVGALLAHDARAFGEFRRLAIG